MFSIFSPLMIKDFHLSHDFQINIVKCQLSLLKQKWNELSPHKKCRAITSLLSYLLQYQRIKESNLSHSETIDKNVKDIFLEILSFFPFKYPFNEHETIVLSFISNNKTMYHVLFHFIFNIQFRLHQTMSYLRFGYSNIKPIIPSLLLEYCYKIFEKK